MGLRSGVDTSRLEKLLRAIPRQIPFAVARTLTALAKDGQAAATERIERAFDRPTKFTKRAVAITSARKGTLVSQVFVKDIQAGYLEIQETGGERRPLPGSPVIVPVNIRTNRSGNLTRGKIKREVQKPTTFVSKQDTPRTAHLPPGIYQRFKRTKRGKARPPKLLVSLEKVARYSERFRFQRTVQEAVAENVQARWRESLIRTLQTMRVK